MMIVMMMMMPPSPSSHELDAVLENVKQVVCDLSTV